MDTPDLIRNHIRRPDLPWRAARLTECGKRNDAVKDLITREEASELVRKFGISRAAFLLCSTCRNTCDLYPTWEQNPVGALEREFRGVPDPGLKDELHAIAALIAAHPEEFAEYLAGLSQTASLADARARRRRALRPTN